MARTRRHVVADVRYGPGNGPSWSECTCGRRFEAATPDLLAKAWNAHRAGVVTPSIERVAVG